MFGSLPNILTITRILFLPFFAGTLIYGYYRFSLILFLAAAVTDFLDGFIARIQKQTTVFGSILDPVADKFFLLTSFIIMGNYGLIPKWLTITVISRDLIIVTGWLILYFVTNKTKVEPSFLGKIAVALQLFLIGMVLLIINITGETFNSIFFMTFVAAITAVSGLHYIFRGLKAVNAENV